jgi:hypothetical protein
MWRRVVACCLAVGALSGCGSDAEIPTLLVTDECSLTGPATLDEGTARLTLQRSGLGDHGAALVQITEGHTTAELEEHFADVSPIWGERPDWVRLRYVVQVEDTNVNSESGDTVLMSLEAGQHAVVCIDYSDDSAQVAADLTVTPNDS